MSSIYTAIDERFATYFLLSSLLLTGSAGNVADMQLGNPVIKSTVHSSDTHGGTEVILGIMHFLEISFAPCIQDLGTLNLHSFLSKKHYLVLNYDLLPDQASQLYIS